MKKLLSLLIAALMLFSLSACGRSGTYDPTSLIPESTKGEDVTRFPAADNVFSLNWNSEYSLNPILATNHSNQLVCSLIYENMVEVDNNFNVIPNVLDEGIPNENATYWIFNIQPGHVFHDGSPVTGQDIRYSLERAVATQDRFRGRFASYQGSGYDETHFYVTLGIGDSQFAKLLNIPIIKAGTMDLKPPVGSGPYTYQDDGKALVAYEGYPGYEDLPIDTIHLVAYTTADEILDSFEDGTIDAVTNDPSSYTNLGYSSANEIHTFATTNLHFVAFNEEGVLGRYSYFRVAMQYAFDREYLTELLHGNAVPAAVPMYPTNPVYPTALAKRLDYNLDLCKRILEAAGVQDYDDDGRLEFMSGSPQEIELNMILCSDSSAKAGIARRFQEDMDSIGLTVNVFEMTWDEYTTALEEGEFKVGNGMVPVDMYYGEVKLRNDFDITELIQVRSKDNERTNINWSRSTDRTLEDWVNLYLASSDAMRADVYNQMCEYLTGTAGSLVTIGFEKQQIITHRGVCKGIDANIGNPLYNFSNWTIDLT